LAPSSILVKVPVRCAFAKKPRKPVFRKREIIKMINSRELAASLASFLSKSAHISTKNTQQFVRLACGKTSEFGGNGIGQVGSDGDNTVGALFEKWRQKFAENSIPESRESIEDILAHCLGTARVRIRLEMILFDRQFADIGRLQIQANGVIRGSNKRNGAFVFKEAEEVSVR
jgi:hypothetical protein